MARADPRARAPPPAAGRPVRPRHRIGVRELQYAEQVLVLRAGQTLGAQGESGGFEPCAAPVAVETQPPLPQPRRPARHRSQAHPRHPIEHVLQPGPQWRCDLVRHQHDLRGPRVLGQAVCASRGKILDAGLPQHTLHVERSPLQVGDELLDAFHVPQPAGGDGARELGQTADEGDEQVVSPRARRELDGERREDGHRVGVTALEARAR